MVKYYPELIAKYPKTMQIFVKKIVHRVDSGKNALIPILGGTGSGKSFAMLTLMIAMHEYMHGETPTAEYINNHVIFKAKDLMAGLNEPNLPKRIVWGWDEVGVDAGHKTAMSVKNRIIGWLAQTFRNLNQIVFFTVPSISFMDASIRKLLHYYLETQYIDRGKKMCVIKPLYVQYNTRMDKAYYHNLTYPVNGYIEEIDMMAIPCPPKVLADIYENKKSIFTSELNKRIQATLEELDVKETPKALQVTEKKPLTILQDRILKLLEQGITSPTKIAEMLGSYKGNICTNFNNLRKKGYNIDKFLKKDAYFEPLLKTEDRLNLTYLKNENVEKKELLLPNV